MSTMERTCKHCEDAKRTYVWIILPARNDSGASSLACSYCDMVAEWPSEKTHERSGS